MKKSRNICKSLGLKQEETAIVLGISRAQWSMFESGKRGLPPRASLLLAEMLAHVQASESESKGQVDQAAAKEKTGKLLEAMLRENEYQQLLVIRKIETARKKQTADFRFWQLANFIEVRNTGKNNSPISLRHLNSKSSKPAETDAGLLLAKLDLKLELLLLEKKFLEGKFQETVQSR